MAKYDHPFTTANRIICFTNADINSINLAITLGVKECRKLFMTRVPRIS